MAAQSGCFTLSGTSTDASCPTVCNGVAEVTVSGGTGDFYYYWSTGDAGEDINKLDGLCPGAYEVVVIDLGELQDDTDYRLGDPPPVIDPTNTCYIEQLSFVIGYQTEICIPDMNCLTDEDAAPGCCPLKATVNTGSASCTTTRDGIIFMDIEGGSGHYTVLWSNGSRMQGKQRVVSGNYSALVRDSEGRTLTVEVPVGVVSATCPTDPDPPTIFLLDELLEAIREVVETLIGPLPSPDELTAPVSCDLFVTVEAMTPATATSTDGEGFISISRPLPGGGFEIFDMVVNGEEHHGKYNETDLPPGVYAGVGVSSQQPTICNPRAGFSFFPACITEAPPCLIDVEADLTLPPDCNGGRCNGVIVLTFHDGTAPYNIEWLDEHGNPQTAVSNTSSYAVNEICSMNMYTFTVTDANGCEGMAGVYAREADKDTECCEAIAGLPPADNELCEGQSLRITLTGGDLYEWPHLPAGQQNTNYVELKPTVSTEYLVRIYRQYCGLTEAERTTEYSFTVRVAKKPNFDISPNEDFFCAPDGKLDMGLEIESEFGLSILSYKWTHRNFGLGGSVSHFTPDNTQSSELDMLDRTSLNGQVIVEYQRSGFTKTCKEIRNFKMNWFDELDDIVIPTSVNVCTSQNTIDLHEIVTGAADQVWEESATGPVINPIAAANYTVTASQTLYVTAISENGCEKAQAVNITLVADPSVSAQITKADCNQPFAQVTLPAGFGYQWFPSQGLSCDDCRNPEINLLDASSTGYTVYYTNDFCESSLLINPEDFQQEVDEHLDNLSITETTPDNTPCPHTFQASYANFVDYTWDMGDGTVYTGVSQVSHTYANEGKYFVTLTAATSCRENVAVYTVHVERENCTCIQ